MGIVDNVQPCADWSFVEVLIAPHESWLSQNGNMQTYYRWPEVIAPPGDLIWNGR